MNRMRFIGALLAAILSLFGCNRKASFDISKAQQTEGEKQAAQSRHPAGWVYVKMLDEDGTVLEEGWEFEKPPEVFETDGLAHLPAYVEKLFSSRNWFSSVTACTIDGDKCIGVWKREGRIEMSEFFPAPGQSALEKRARSICSDRGFPINQEYLTDDGQRSISWILPNDSKVVVEVLKQFAQEIHSIPERAGLNIKIEEHRDDRNKHPGAGAVSFIFTYPIQDPSAPPPSTRMN